MKYLVKLLTQSGIIEIICTPETVEQQQMEVREKHGDFVTISATPIN